MDGKSRILSNKAYLVGAAMGLGDGVSRLEIGSGHKYWSIFLRLSFLGNSGSNAEHGEMEPIWPDDF